MAPGNVRFWACAVFLVGVGFDLVAIIALLALINMT
jgi:hypothetical protein